MDKPYDIYELVVIFKDPKNSKANIKFTEKYKHKLSMLTAEYGLATFKTDDRVIFSFDMKWHINSIKRLLSTCFDCEDDIITHWKLASTELSTFDKHYLETSDLCHDEPETDYDETWKDLSLAILNNPVSEQYSEPNPDHKNKPDAYDVLFGRASYKKKGDKTI